MVAYRVPVRKTEWGVRLVRTLRGWKLKRVRVREEWCGLSAMYLVGCAVACEYRAARANALLFALFIRPWSIGKPRDYAVIIGNIPSLLLVYSHDDYTSLSRLSYRKWREPTNDAGSILFTYMHACFLLATTFALSIKRYSQSMHPQGIPTLPFLYLHTKSMEFRIVHRDRTLFFYNQIRTRNCSDDINQPTIHKKKQRFPCKEHGKSPGSQSFDSDNQDLKNSLISVIGVAL